MSKGPSKLSSELTSRVARATREHALEDEVEQLRASGLHWLSILETVPGYIAVLDLKFRYTYINKDTPPFSNDAVIGKTPFDIFPNDQHETIQQTLNTVSNESRTHSCTVRFDEDTKKYFYKLYICPVERGDKHAGYAIVAHDITHEEHVQRDTQEQALLLEALLTTSPLAVWRADTTGKLSHVNESWIELTGLSLEDSLGDGWLDGVDKQDRDEVREAWNTTIKQASNLDIEFRLTTPTRATSWVRALVKPIRDSAGHITEYIGTIVDISEQKDFERTLREVARAVATPFTGGALDSLACSLRQLTGCSLVIIGRLCRTEQGTVEILTTCSEESGESIELPDNYELKGTPCEDVLTGETGLCIYESGAFERFPDDAFLLIHNFHGYAGIPIITHGDEFGILSVFFKEPIKKIDHLQYALEIYAVKVGAELERQDSERRERELGTQLQRAQRMETLGTLTGGVAHDFNNILTPIIGNLELYLAESSESSITKGLRDALTAALRGKDMAEHLLQYGRADNPIEKMAIDVRETVQEVCQLVKGLLPNSITISCEVDTHCPNVFANETQLHQVFVNLATNSFQALKDLSEGAISFSVSAASATQVSISVSDNGSGIDQAVIDRIFDPYFTTKAPGRGTGLGLAMVQAIVTAHDGTITVDSASGIGTTITISLPAHTSQKTEVPEDSDDQESYTFTPAAILFVDDEQSIASMGKQILEREGHRVQIFTDPKEALEHLRNSAETVDIIITDQTMPGITGIELAREAWKMRPELPILLTSGFSAENTSGADLSNERISFLKKPYLISELHLAISRALNS